MIKASRADYPGSFSRVECEAIQSEAQSGLLHFRCAFQCLRAEFAITEKYGEE